MLAADAAELDCAAELESVEDLIENGTGAHRQLALCREAEDLRGLVAEVAEHTRP